MRARRARRPMTLMALGIVAALITAGTAAQQSVSPSTQQRPPALSTPSAVPVTEPATIAAAPATGDVWLLPNSRLPLKTLDHGLFKIGYDEQAKNPAWVAYRLTGSITIHAQQVRPATFETDFSTTAHVAHSDYLRSGYDRGHLCPAYAIFSRYGDGAMRSTFIMSNVIPQVHSLNAGVWEDLESAIAGRESRGSGWASTQGPLTIINGPLYDTRPATRRLTNGTWIPDAVFGVVITQRSGPPEALAFIMPNTDGVTGPLSRYQVTIREIERRSALTLVPTLDALAQEAFRSQGTGKLWR